MSVRAALVHAGFTVAATAALACTSSSNPSTPPPGEAGPPPCGQTTCGAASIDTCSDPQNCGGCGDICVDNATCVQGACVVAAPGGDAGPQRDGGATDAAPLDAAPLDAAPPDGGSPDAAPDGGLGCGARGVSCDGGTCPSPTMSCSVSGCAGWALWKMPNFAGGLPNPASYDATSTPGVVIDNVTGLWWQQPMDGNDTRGTNCAGGCTQTDAMAYCAHLSLAGHCDWRLPTRIELASIVDTSVVNPSINGSAFPGTPVSTFWTASNYGGRSGVAWGIGFGLGGTGAYPIGTSNRVRCVR